MRRWSSASLVIACIVISAVASLVVHGSVMAAHGPSIAEHAHTTAPMAEDDAIPGLLAFASCFAIVVTALVRLATWRPSTPTVGIVAVPVSAAAFGTRAPARTGRHPPDDGTVLRP